MYLKMHSIGLIGIINPPPSSSICRECSSCGSVFVWRNYMKGKLVKNLAKRGCITIQKNSKIDELINLLSSHNIGAVVVIDEDKKPIGMVSERDIVRNYNKNKNNIKNIMTTNLISCDPSISSSELMELMNRHKIRHVPILEKNKLVGIVSIGDVVKRLIEIYETENTNLKNYINS